MALVDIPRVSLGFVEVAIQTEAEFVAQRTGQAKVSAFGVGMLDTRVSGKFFLKGSSRLL